MAREGYAHPEFLVDAEWVDAHKDDANVVIVDCDVEVGFVRGHIPGAVLVPDNYEKNPDTGRVLLMEPDQFKAMCQGLGIGEDTLVITYDNSQSLTATRLWWALNTYGHSNVKILDGGWRRWVAEGRTISFDRAHPNTSVTFTPKRDESLLVKWMNSKPPVTSATRLSGTCGVTGSGTAAIAGATSGLATCREPFIWNGST